MVTCCPKRFLYYLPETLRNWIEIEEKIVFHIVGYILQDKIIVRPLGVEPKTFGSGGQRSIQLSYGRIIELLIVRKFHMNVKSLIHDGRTVKWLLFFP